MSIKSCFRCCRFAIAFTPITAFFVLRLGKYSPLVSSTKKERGRTIYQAVEKGQKLGQIAFISKNLSMSEGLIKV